jgi:hypothetical protein
MGIMMLFVVIAVVAVGLGVAVAAFGFGQRQLSAPPSTESDRLLREQADRIDELEQELRRLKEQADFTEKLLEQRGGGESERLPPGDRPEAS